MPGRSNMRPVRDISLCKYAYSYEKVCWIVVLKFNRLMLKIQINSSGPFHNFDMLSIQGLAKFNGKVC